MADIKTWSTSAAGNNFTVPDGFPEAMEQRWFNDACREVMAALKRDYIDPEWLEIAYGYTITRISASQVKLANFLGLTYFPVGARVRLLPGPVYCNITASSLVGSDVFVDVDGAVPVGVTSLSRFISAFVRTAAFNDTGTAIGQIPVNTSAAALGSAAYKNQSTAIGDVPVNVVAAVLGTAAYKDQGPTVGAVPLNTVAAQLGTAAYTDKPKRTYGKKTADQAYGGGAIALVTSLSNLAITGADGVRKFRIHAHLNYSVTGAAGTTVTLTMKIGAAGTTADATVLTIPHTLATNGVIVSFDLAGFETTAAPAVGDKISLCYTDASAATLQGSGTNFGWIEVVEIQE